MILVWRADHMSPYCSHCFWSPSSPRGKKTKQIAADWSTDCVFGAKLEPEGFCWRLQMWQSWSWVQWNVWIFGQSNLADLVIATFKNSIKKKVSPSPPFFIFLFSSPIIHHVDSLLFSPCFYVSVGHLNLPPGGVKAGETLPRWWFYTVRVRI